MTETGNNLENQNNQKRQGVVAYFKHQDKVYGIKPLVENDGKFEVILDNSLKLHNTKESPYGYLKEQSVGLIGGGAKSNEPLPQALAREMEKELRDLGITDKEKIDEVTALIPDKLTEIENFKVLQATQANLNNEAKFRGLFKVHYAQIPLNQNMFEYLKPFLVDLESVDQKKLRPLARSFLSLVLKKTHSLLLLQKSSNSFDRGRGDRA